MLDTFSNKLCSFVFNVTVRITWAATQVLTGSVTMLLDTQESRL